MEALSLSAPYRIVLGARRMNMSKPDCQGLTVPIGATGGMAGKDPFEEWIDLMERLDFNLGDGVNNSLMCFMA